MDCLATASVRASTHLPSRLRETLGSLDVSVDSVSLLNFGRLHRASITKPKPSIAVRFRYGR